MCVSALVLDLHHVDDGEGLVARPVLVISPWASSSAMWPSEAPAPSRMPANASALDSSLLALSAPNELSNRPMLSPHRSMSGIWMLSSVLAEMSHKKRL